MCSCSLHCFPTPEPSKGTVLQISSGCPLICKTANGNLPRSIILARDITWNIGACYTARHGTFECCVGEGNTATVVTLASRPHPPCRDRYLLNENMTSKCSVVCNDDKRESRVSTITTAHRAKRAEYVIHHTFAHRTHTHTSHVTGFFAFLDFGIRIILDKIATILPIHYRVTTKMIM